MATSGSFNTNAEPTWGMIYVTFKWSVRSQSTDSNQTVIDWSIEGGGTTTKYYESGPFTVVIDGETVYNSSARIKMFVGTVVAGGTHIITHNSDGSRLFSASVQAAVYSGSVNCTGSGTWDLPTIARESSLSVSAGTLGVAQDLSVAMQSAAFTHTITYSCGNLSGTVCTGSSDATLSWTPPLDLAAAAPSGTAVSVNFVIITYSGNTQIGSPQSAAATYAIPDTVKPTVDSITVTDPTGWKDVFGSFIQGASKLAISVSYSGAYGSTVKSCKITADGKTYIGNPITVDSVISSQNTLTVGVTVVDSRGRSNTGETTIAVTPYERPKITSLKAARCDENGIENSKGDYLLVYFSASVTPLDNKNNVAYTLMWKKSTDTVYPEDQKRELDAVYDPYNASNETEWFPAETGSSYDILLIVEDSIDSASLHAKGPTIKTSWSWFKNWAGLTLGAVAEKAGFNVHWPSEFHEGITMSGESGISMQGLPISGLPDPTEDSDAIPKSYAHTYFAPAGYGLGTTPSQVATSLADCDNLVKNGWYRFSCMGTTLCGVTFNYGSLFVMNNSESDAVWQEIRPMNTHYVLCRFRNSDGVTWSEWARMDFEQLYSNSHDGVGVGWKLGAYQKAQLIMANDTEKPWCFWLGVYCFDPDNGICMLEKVSSFGLSAIGNSVGTISLIRDDGTSVLCNFRTISNASV